METSEIVNERNMTYDEWRDVIYAWACDKGWWEREIDRDVETKIALIHSELSEALEEFRHGRPAVWEGENGKPEGIAVEIADTVVRILDLSGYLGGEVDRYMEQARGYVRGETRETHAGPDTEMAGLPFGRQIARTHLMLSSAFVCSHSMDDKPEWLQGELAKVIAACEIIVAEQGRNMGELLSLKHRYNETREYRHGGRTC